MKTYLGEWMNHFDLNPVQLSEKSGISQKMISKWITGEITPSLQAITVLADTMDILIDDIVKRPPSASTEDFTSRHVIETGDLKVVVRVQNYLKKHEIDCDTVAVISGKEAKSFIIQYQMDAPIEPKDIVKISKTGKYKDAREKANDDSRYEGMTICRIEK